jgi:glycosyltransferase involved in cell wall biosynthesis
MDKSFKANHVFVFLELFSQEGGIQSYVKDVLEAYETLDYRAEVFLLRDEPNINNPFKSEIFKFHYLKTLPPFLGRLRLAWSLLICLLMGRQDRVFCGHIKLAPLIRFYCQALNIPYTVLTYGKEVWQTLPYLQRQALQQAASIWTISRYSGDRLCQANQVHGNRVKILSCVVDGNQFTPGEKPSPLLTKYNLKNAQVLMTVARLWSGDIYKGVDVTIRALPQILKVFPAVKYLVIGRGDDRPRLEKLAEDLGVENQVIFAGFVPREDLVNHYRVADAYIMPSQEGFGIVYLEAMVCGIPVLSGNADGSADPLQDGRLGWRVPHRDVNAVALACIEILQGEDPRTKGKWLREETLAKFSKQAFREKLNLSLGNGDH